MIRTSIQLFTVLAIFCLTFSSCQEAKPQATTEGFIFTVHTSNGTATPQPGEYAYFEMDITSDTGEVLQSMRNLDQMPVIQMPAADAPQQQPNPILEVLSTMSIGDSATMVVPIDSIPSATSEIKKFKEIRYEIVLRNIKDKDSYDAQLKLDSEKMAAEREAVVARLSEVTTTTASVLADYKSGANADQVIKDETGLEYIIHEKGNGEIGKPGDNVMAHYYGVLKSDGTFFDSSFKKGTPFGFTLGRGGAIQGWDVAFQRIPKGSKATLFIPYEMAYGAAGRAPLIPEKADLVFYVELQE